ncbi:MAG: segregation/condensation protein A [Candidatus Paceibacterota bacterium]
MYAIKVGQFEGPLDLLLGLIEKKKLSINDVSLSEIADQYLEYLKKMENFPLEEVVVFIVVASTLMLIKSHSLMPSLELSEEEEKSIEELEERLKIYRRIKELSINIKELFGKNPIFSREGFRGAELGFLEPKGLSKEIVYKILNDLVQNLPAKECLPEAEVKKIISLEDKVKDLVGRMQQRLELSFAEFSTAKTKNGEMRDKKLEVIVSFLAMLELIKQGLIIVNQANLFDNIKICSINGNGVNNNG